MTVTPVSRYARTYSTKLFVALIGAVFGVALSASFAHAAPYKSGKRMSEMGMCYNMLILKVVDGDTVYGYIDTSDPMIAVRAKLRLSGIDAPERKGRAKCVAEAQKGDAARDYLTEMLSTAIGKRSRLLARACHVRRGKYASRRLGRLEVRLRNGWVNMNDLLLAKGHAIPYQGGRRGRTWCNCLEKGDCPAGYNERAADRARAEGRRGKRG